MWLQMQMQVMVVVVECLILMMVMPWWLSFKFNDWLITMVADSVCGLIQFVLFAIVGYDNEDDDNNNER
jgi:hypothetical protein